MKTARTRTARRPRFLAIALLVSTFVLALTVGMQPALAAVPKTGLLIDSSYPSYGATESYSLRGVALSPDDSVVYVTWLHTGTGKKIEAYDTTTGTLLQSINVEATVDDVPTVAQVKSIAVDSRGYVFAGTGDDGGVVPPFIRAYSADLQTAYSTITTRVMRIS